MSEDSSSSADSNEQENKTEAAQADEIQASAEVTDEAKEDVALDSAKTEGGEQPAVQPQEPVQKFAVSVRYGLAGLREEFITEEEALRVGDMVVIKTGRGIDHGIVLGRPREASATISGLGEVMRKATESDYNILDHIKSSKEPEELRFCQECVEKRKLPMDLSGIEHLFGGDKIIFYFLSEGRVDFRELVKDLARRYRTRIEMRQIGVRDEARMLSDYERCGQELCCRTFLKDLEPVSMRMAKMQKSTLDPNKISGHCGRLMCCLRFEDDVYKENRKGLPNRGDLVEQEGRKGRTINTDVLTRMVYVEFEDGERDKVHVDDLKRLPKSGGGKPGGNPRQNRNDHNRNQNRGGNENSGKNANSQSSGCGGGCADGCGGGCGKKQDDSSGS